MVTPGWRWVWTSSQRDGIGPEDAEVGDHEVGPAAAQAELGPAARSVAEADAGAEVAVLDEGAHRLAHDHDHPPGERRDLRRATGSGQPGVRGGVLADHGGVDVAEPVELGGAEEPDVDPAALQPVREDLGHRDDGIGGLGELAVADRERQAGRLRTDAARLVDEDATGSVQPASEVRGSARQADADEAARPIGQRPGCADDHHLVAGVALVVEAHCWPSQGYRAVSPAA